MKLPVVIGVTGHRDLREKDIPFLRDAVRSELDGLKNRCPDTPFVMLSSLAAGSDMLCSSIALDLGFRLVCPIPMDTEEYVKDFSEEEHHVFKELIQRADEVFTVPDAEYKSENVHRDFFYRQSGIYIASHSHILLALWDGEEGRQSGCGTAETVDFMLKQNEDTSCGSFFKASSDGSVLQIITPRTSNPEVFNAFKSIRIENETGAFEKMLCKTQGFNQDEKKHPVRPSSVLMDERTSEQSGSRAKRLHEAYQTADTLSVIFQKRYLWLLKCLSLSAMLLVLSFLFYDELESDIFLIVYGIMLLVTFQIWLISKRSDYHRKYIEYRTLAEAMRVQFFLTLYGRNQNVCDSFTWSQKNDAVWIKEAVTSLIIGEEDEFKISPDILKKVWIDEQRNYHESAMKRDAAKYKMNNVWTSGLLALSILMFLLVIAIEFFNKDLIRTVYNLDAVRTLFLMHEGQNLILRGVFKIILGGIPAAVVLLSGYYGKLSLQQKVSDHQRMIALYNLAQTRFHEKNADKGRILEELAREEIMENGNWLSYCRVNTPKINF